LLVAVLEVAQQALEAGKVAAALEVIVLQPVFLLQQVRRIPSQ
jgi:hypothetical protein